MSLRDDRAGVRPATRRWRLPVVLLLSVLAHLLLLDGLRLPSVRAPVEPPVVVAELLPPAPVPPPASPAAPPAPPVARSKPPPRAAATRPVVPPPQRPVADHLPAVPSAAPPAEAPVAPAVSGDPSPEARTRATPTEDDNARGDDGAGSPTPAAAAQPAQAVCAADAPQPDLPAPHPALARRWVYDVYFGNYDELRIIARVTYQLELSGDRYTMRSEGAARGLTAWLYSGLITQASSGRITAAGLQPERYVEQRGSRAARVVEVDREHCQAVFGAGERQPLAAGVQDRLSSLIQLGLMARGSPASFAPGQGVTLNELTLGRQQPVRYRSAGEQTLATPDGDLRALHLVRLRDETEDPTIEVWLGYDLAMLPVRIRVTEYNGRVFDQLLNKAPG